MFSWLKSAALFLFVGVPVLFTLWLGWKVMQLRKANAQHV